MNPSERFSIYADEQGGIIMPLGYFHSRERAQEIAKVYERIYPALELRAMKDLEVTKVRP